jgi:hypothetical protein
MPLFTPANLRGTFDLAHGVPLGRARFVFGSDYWLTRLAEAKNSQAEYHRKQAESAPHDIWQTQVSIDTGASAALYAEGELEDALHKALCSGEDAALSCKRAKSSIWRRSSMH